MTHQHRVARWHAAHGLSVFPCAPGMKVPLFPKCKTCPSGEKHCDGVGHGYLDATTDLALIDAWWSTRPHANVGIALAASELMVVDVDERHGGRDGLADLERQHGRLPATWHEHTGARLTGDHFVYQRPPGVKPGKGTLAEGVEVLATGYIVTAPSVHPDGGVYTWCLGEAPWDLALAVAPPWVLAALDKRPARHVGGPTGPVADSLLARAFQLAGWWIRQIDETRAVVLCPWRDEHTVGRDGDSSTVLFAPTTDKKIGKLFCAHSHCRDRSVRDVLAALPAETVAVAEAALGRERSIAVLPICKRIARPVCRQVRTVTLKVVA